MDEIDTYRCAIRGLFTLETGTMTVSTTIHTEHTHFMASLSPPTA